MSVVDAATAVPACSPRAVAPCLLSLLSLLLAIDMATAQDGQPPQRVANESLLIDLRRGDPPATIAASGLYSDMSTRTVSPGIIPYAVNAELWADGAFKERFLALPGLEQIEFAAATPWRFPTNTVLVKSFGVEFEAGNAASRDLIETRFLVHAGDGEWRGFSYRWNDDGSDAVLLESDAVGSYFVVDAAAEGGLREHRHLFPSRPQCAQCHTAAAGFALGVTTAQTNLERDVGGRVRNQLQAWNDMGLFRTDISERLTTAPRMADPFDDRRDLGERARSYLAANCAHCHRPGVVDKADFDVRFETPLEGTRIVNRIPTLASFDLVDARILKPGDAANSSLVARMRALDSGRMPPVASEVVDGQGVQLLRRWIDSLDPQTRVEAAAAAPEPTALARSYPNPFNQSTVIGFRLDKEGPAALVVFDAAGRQVRVLAAGRLRAGVHERRWDGTDAAGRQVSSGIYFYRLRTGGREWVHRLTLLE